MLLGIASYQSIDRCTELYKSHCDYSLSNENSSTKQFVFIIVDTTVLRPIIQPIIRMKLKTLYSYFHKKYIKLFSGKISIVNSVVFNYSLWTFSKNSNIKTNLCIRRVVFELTYTKGDCWSIDFANFLKINNERIHTLLSSFRNSKYIY